MNNPRLSGWLSGRRGFWLAVSVQVVILLTMIVIHTFTLVTGTAVRLKTAPIDPWDLFRGEYVILRYEISRLGPDTVKMSGTPFRQHELVWVTLREGTPFWQATAASKERPAPGPGEVVLRGRVDMVWEGPSEPEPVRREGAPAPEPDERQRPRPWQAGEILVRYGIEQFYVPEGEGAALERRATELDVEAVVDRFGRAAIRSIFLDGKRIEWQ